MPPLTRRAAKAKGETPRKSPPADPPASAPEVRSDMLFEEPIALRSKRKPSSNAGEEGASMETPRRKKLEVRTRKDGAGFKSSIEVQIPSSAIMTPRPRSSPVPDSQDTAASDEPPQPLEPLSASKQLEEEAAQKLATQSQGLEQAPELEAERSLPLKPAKSTHVVFGDDDAVDKFVAAAARKEKPAAEINSGDGDEEEAESGDDDEAPEAVSTAAAAKETLKSTRAAIEAAEQYAASTKRRRQARDALLKRQADKRKRTKPTSKSSEKEDLSGDEDGEDETEDRNAASKRQRRTQKLPDMLPAEFLTDSSSEDEDDKTALKKMIKRPQKITFEAAMQALGAEGRAPRDEVVGSTRYRVLADQGDPRLAPKANGRSRRAKEDLLRRGRARISSNKKRGFFVKKR